MPLSDEDVREILRIIDESELDELRIETEGFALHVLRGAAGTDSSRPPLAPRGDREEPAPPATGTPKLTEAAGEAVRPSRAEVEDRLVTIDSPMLGTFYRGEAPGAEPFVEVGSRVEPDTTVCIIEVMKMMNSVPARVSGTVVEVCPENAELVEYGQPLFRVQP
jgi:acetyl-CoA carboxylase biotin carboxyl carrier protein